MSDNFCDSEIYLIMQPDPRRADVLTSRERQVLKLIAAGLSSKEIASALGISFKTVVCHRTRILDKLDMHCTADLTRYAMRHQLVREDVAEEERLGRQMRVSHRNYMDALTNYNEFLKERESLGLTNPDSCERTRQLFRAERQRHDEYSTALRVWADFVLGNG
jgi:DNA-binding CsgD family transcriptional regulator